MGYTHYDKVSANSFAIGQKGSEVDVSADEFIINGVIDDISNGASNWVVSPYAGTIENIYTVIDAAITTAATAAISFEIGGTAVTDGGITIGGSTAQSAAGVVDSSTPSALNTVAAGGAIELISDGGSTNASKAEVTLVCKRT